MWAVKEVLNHVLLKIVFKNSYQTTLTFEFHCSTELGCHFLLQGIFLTQELNPTLSALAGGFLMATWEAHRTGNYIQYLV